MQANLDDVWVHMPDPKIKRPPDVSPGQPGVDEFSYNRIHRSTMLELQARMRANQVPEEHWDNELLNDAFSMMVCARMLRRMRSYQEVADSLFADANIKIRLFMEGVVGIVEDAGTIETVSTESTVSPWLPNVTDWVNGFVED